MFAPSFELEDGQTVSRCGGDHDPFCFLWPGRLGVVGGRLFPLGYRLLSFLFYARVGDRLRVKVLG